MFRYDMCMCVFCRYTRLSSAGVLSRRTAIEGFPNCDHVFLMRPTRINRLHKSDTRPFYFSHPLVSGKLIIFIVLNACLMLVCVYY